MEFTKMHGAANDFIVVDARNMKRDWPSLAITVCDRHRGIGCDSLITVLDSSKAHYAMRTYDADGSESETCGNGLRCVARYVLEKGLVEPDIEEIKIETLSEVSTVKPERKDGKVVKFWANLGKPRLTAEQINLNQKVGKGEFFSKNSLIDYRVRVDGMEVTLNLVSMGNPHAILFTTEPVKNFPMEKIGPLVENLPIFPNRTNFQVARVLDYDTIEARVWEKGIGETMACGSGTCAITVASKMNGYTGPKVKVHLPGGILDASYNGTGEVVIGGPAVVVYEGVWPD
jgi:diaminopimelate epimerase